MALKFFLIYAGGFLASSMILMALIRPLSASFGNQGKRPLIFSFVASAIASGIGFAVTFLSKNLFIIYWALSATFLFFGIIFLALVHKKYFKARRDNRNKQLIAEVLFGLSVVMLCVAMFSSLQFFLKDPNFMFFPVLLCMLWFFVPVLLLHCFDAAYEIPPPDYTRWQYPVNAAIDLPDEKPNERLYVIGFEIAKKDIDRKRTFFRAKAPEGMKMGDLFYHFVNDYNDQYSETPIEYRNDNRVQPWVFRTRPKWHKFSRVLDPSLTVNQNRVKENTVIVCERMED